MWGGCGVQDKSYEHVRVKSWERCKDKKLRSSILADWRADSVTGGVSSARRGSCSCRYSLGICQTCSGLYQSTIRLQQPAACSFRAHIYRHLWKPRTRFWVHRVSHFIFPFFFVCSFFLWMVCLYILVLVSFF